MRNPRKKIALVTGASSGMGKDIAKQLIEDGYHVFAAARNVEKMADLGALGATLLQMDISREDDIRAAVDVVLNEGGTVDVLVNNAGFGLYGPVEEITLDEARYQFEVNLFGAARLTQLILPAMRAQRSGTIVNITSIGGKIYSVLGAWYHATKHALEGWSDCLRLEVAPFGIRVVIVEPGVIETGFGDAASGNLLKRSAGGPYAKLAQAVANAITNTYGKGTGSPGTVIADVVSKAVKARRPKTRYAAGKYARMLLGMRKWLSDRTFDSVIMSQMK
ncbi:oxidoreductase [Ancylobacter sonchi]|uniref:oxidoreductase n=1 Tax=Ancylobacter sonchi TaxID=1937790 RepID=UPI001BD30AF6|nr:oxidoreductase [Ancylobacter sonchi]MBS7532413.1 oxidoreductase [Ancylobacter sonchi]